MYSIKEIVDDISIIKDQNEMERELWFYLGNFLDYFYNEKVSNENRLELVREEPINYENVSKKTYAFLAGTVHFLCIKYKLKVPTWVRHEKYVLKDPYFSLNARGNLRLVLLKESPMPFRVRNIFVSANTLDRA